MKKIKLDDSMTNNNLLISQIKANKAFKQNEYVYLDIILKMKNFFDASLKDENFLSISPVKIDPRHTVFSFLTQVGMYSVYGEIKKIKDEFYLIDLKSMGYIKENYVFVTDVRYGFIFSRSYDVDSKIPKFY